MWEIQNSSLIAVLAVALSALMSSCNSDGQSLAAETPVFQRLDIVDVMIAGDLGRLAFLGPDGIDAYLQLDNSYGSMVISPNSKERGLVFLLPDPITQVAGLCTWKLIHKNQVIFNGNLSILPQTGSGIRMESYLGPKDIIAGDSGKAMVVSIPADPFDNPLPDGTPVWIEERFKGTTESIIDSLENLISWRHIEPETRSGRIFVKTMTGSSPSIEMYTDVSSGAGTDFEISYERNHDFADGNQVIRLKTSVIKDRFENTVADGTLVTFHIENGEETSLYTNATTVNGIAVAKIVHPVVATRWKLTAIIAGVASSNTLEMNFNSAVEEFEAAFSAEGQILSIGPINSFMGQLVPDFTPAEILLNYEVGRQERITIYTRGGYAQFDVKTLIHDTLPTHIEIRILGRTKTINP
ncbi:hypothetical protein [uncultured Eudoraea sp.]|uniref:hypothetical protein n=1 Tax=uncultured Eudoraea sp. TaxID=1035614 RepID=UPI002621A6D2|nr:hypothetical protein [uncultured Eudoraea sp.]